MNHVTLPLHNLGFQGAHAAHAERAITQLPGVVRAYICSDTEMAYIEYEVEQIAPSSIQEALVASGFGAPLQASDMPSLAAREAAPPVRRRVRGYLAAAGALWLLLSGILFVVSVSRGVAMWAILLVASGALVAVVLVGEWRLSRREQKVPVSYQPPAERVRGTYASARRDRWL